MGAIYSTCCANGDGYDTDLSRPPPYRSLLRPNSTERVYSVPRIVTDEDVLLAEDGDASRDDGVEENEEEKVDKPVTPPKQIVRQPSFRNYNLVDRRYSDFARYKPAESSPTLTTTNTSTTTTTSPTPKAMKETKLYQGLKKKKNSENLVMMMADADEKVVEESKNQTTTIRNGQYGYSNEEEEEEQQVEKTDAANLLLKRTVSLKKQLNVFGDFGGSKSRTNSVSSLSSIESYDSSHINNLQRQDSSSNNNGHPVVVPVPVSVQTHVRRHSELTAAIQSNRECAIPIKNVVRRRRRRNQHSKRRANTSPEVYHGISPGSAERMSPLICDFAVIESQQEGDDDQVKKSSEIRRKWENAALFCS